MERRGRHKPLSSYFEDEDSDREGNVDHQTESQGGSHTQGRTERCGKINTTAGSSNLGFPTNHMVNSTPSGDEDSVTGRSNVSHQLMHYVDVTFLESESEADLNAFTQPAAKRKYTGYSGSPSKRRKPSVEEDDDSITESDDDGPCMYPRIPCSRPLKLSTTPFALCYFSWPSICPRSFQWRDI